MIQSLQSKSSYFTLFKIHPECLVDFTITLKLFNKAYSYFIILHCFKQNITCCHVFCHCILEVQFYVSLHSSDPAAVSIITTDSIFVQEAHLDMNTIYPSFFPILLIGLVVCLSLPLPLKPVYTITAVAQVDVTKGVICRQSKLTLQKQCQRQKII